MRHPTIRTAEHVARSAQGDGAIVIIFDGDQMAGASWGANVPRCKRLGRMLDAIMEELMSGRIHGEPAPAGRAPIPEPQAEEWEEFVAEATDLLGTLDDLPERASDFAEGVREKLTGMIEWATDKEHVTPAMQTALENMEAGVSRWER